MHFISHAQIFNTNLFIHMKYALSFSSPLGRNVICEFFVNGSRQVATDWSLNSQPNAVRCRGVLLVLVVAVRAFNVD